MTLESPLDSKEIKPVNPKEINPEYSLKDWCWSWSSSTYGHLMRKADTLEKTLMLGNDWQQKKWATEDELVQWRHQFNGREFEQTGR